MVSPLSILLLGAAMTRWPSDGPDAPGPLPFADVELLDEDFVLSFLSPLSDSETHLGSIADATDSDGAESSTTISSSSPLSPYQGGDGGKCNSKETARLATNQARLDRYYKTQSELGGLRRKVEELQSLLEKLKEEDEHLPAASLECEPCPFIDYVQDELSGRSVDSKLAGRESTVSWKCVAMHEHRRRQRAVAVRRKLRRLLRDFERDGENYMRKLPINSVGARYCDCLRAPKLTEYLMSSQDTKTHHWSSPFYLPVLPIPPGANTAEAFSLCGVAMLRELYRMACSACDIQGVTTQSKSSPGGELAYSFLLGADIETQWTREFVFPGGDPQDISSLWLRGVWNQAPNNANFRISIKVTSCLHSISSKVPIHCAHMLCLCLQRPAVERSFYERKFAWRPDSKVLVAQENRDVNLDGVTLMQIFESTDHVVLVWTVSFYASDDTACQSPFFRASGWMGFRRQGNGVTCQSCARVHSTPTTMGGIEDVTLRRRVVNAWAKTMQTKQHRMWNRLLLVT